MDLKTEPHRLFFAAAVAPYLNTLSFLLNRLVALNSLLFSSNVVFKIVFCRGEPYILIALILLLIVAMEQLVLKDTLNLKDDKSLMKALGQERNFSVTTELFWSGELTKINKRKKSQVRRFILTSKRFINLGDEKLFDSIMSFFSGNSFKRAIELADIHYITYSEVSNEFILHVPKEYDYRLRSSNA